MRRAALLALVVVAGVAAAPVRADPSRFPEDALPPGVVRARSAAARASAGRTEVSPPPSTTSSPSAPRRRPWYRSFYARVGRRDVYPLPTESCRFDGISTRYGPGCLHAYVGLSYGFGYRLERRGWGVDASVLNLQLDVTQGLHTLTKVVGYVQRQHGRLEGLWLGAGASVGWIRGVVYAAIAKRRGYGAHGEVVVGYELPPVKRVRTFAHLALTVPLYRLDNTYHSSDSTVYVVGIETAFGVRF